MQGFRVQDIGDVLVSGPVRYREGDGIAFIQQGLGQVVENMLGTDAGSDIGARVATQPGAFDMAQKGIEQNIGAAVGSVLA